MQQAGDDDLEQTIFSVRPTLIFVKLGYLLAVLGGIALVFLLALIPVSPFISIALALALLLIPAYFHIKRNMIRYTLTDSKMEIDTGLIARTTRNIPLSKIQDVTVSASIPQRILGFGDLIVDNASEMGGTTVLHNINNAPLCRPAFARAAALALNYRPPACDAQLKYIQGTSNRRRVLTEPAHFRTLRGVSLRVLSSILLLLVLVGGNAVVAPAKVTIQEVAKSLPREVAGFRLSGPVRYTVLPSGTGATKELTFTGPVNVQGQGSAVVEADYVSPDGKKLLVQLSRFERDSDAYSQLTFYAITDRSTDPPARLTREIGTTSLAVPGRIAFFKGTAFVEISDSSTPGTMQRNYLPLQRHCEPPGKR